MAIKVGKIFKRVFITLGVILVLFVAAAFAIPYFYKDRLLDEAKKFANTQVNATVDFDNDQVEISLLWTFPNFKFSIGDFSVTGKDEFEGKKLANIGNFNFELNLMDVINGDYIVKAIELNEADLYVKVLRNGKANYDIMIPSEEQADTSSSELAFSINEYAINKTNVIYDDETMEVYLDIKDFNHSGKGDFTTTQFDLETRTDIAAVTFAMGGINYLSKAKVGATLNARINTAEGTYELLDNSLEVNALELKADGKATMKEGSDDIGLDFKFSAPNTSFASVLSLVPAAYNSSFKDITTKGTFNFDGYAKGNYNSKKETLPQFAINLDVKDASFKYAELPLGVDDIRVDLKVKSTTSNLDNILVDINDFHFAIGDNPFDVKLKLRTPISDPDIDAKVDGIINLGQLAKAFPMEGVSELSGIVKANLEAKTRISYIDNSEYEKVKLKGMLGISYAKYVSTDLPVVDIKNIAVNFTSNEVDLQDVDVKIGKSDIKASGKLDNILTYFSREKIMTGAIKVKSKLLDLNEIMNAGGGSETATEEVVEDENLATKMSDTTTANASEKIFDQYDFVMAAEFDEIKYDVYDIKNLKTSGHFSPTRADLKNFEVLIGKVDVKANGTLENIYGYLFDEEIIKGVLNVQSNYMNLNQFMNESGAATEPEAAENEPEDMAEVESDLEPIQIPANIDFTLNAAAKELLYDTYKFKNALAQVHIHDQILDISSFTADGFGGKMALNGSYNTQNAAEPTFDLGYNVEQLNIQEIAKQVGLAKRFVPMLEAVYGKFNSDFKIKGVLDKNMYPKVSSLTSSGYFKTFDALVKGSPALNTLSDKLKMPDLSKINLSNTTNFFRIKDGQLEIDPATHQIAGMDVIFGGKHGLNNIMNYDLKMRVPRAMLNKDPIGQAANNAANTGLSALAGQASKLGIKVENSEFLNIGVDIGGTPQKPTFGINLLGAEGKAGESLGNQVTNKVKEEADKLKEEAEAKLNAEKDRIKAEAQAKIDEEKARIKAEADRIKAESEEKAKKLAQQAASDPKGALDSLKGALDNIKTGGLPNVPNPFGGKKDDKEDKKPFGIKNPFK